MAKYKGSVELIAGLTQKNKAAGNNFALVDAADVQVDDTGKRLNTRLDELAAGIGNGDGTPVDLSNYYNKTEADAAFAKATDLAETNTTLQAVKAKADANAEEIAALKASSGNGGNVDLTEYAKTADLENGEVTVKSAESAMYATYDEVGRNISQYYALQTDLEQLRNSFDYSGQITTLQQDVADHETRIANLESGQGGSGESVDLDNYYTKDEADGTFAKTADLENHETRIKALEDGGIDGEGTDSSGNSYLPLAAVITGTWASFNMSEHFYLASASYLIDWGDGTVDTEPNHTYESEGEYTIKVYGAFTEFGIIGGFGFTQRAAITDVMVDVETIRNNGFNSFSNLKNVTLSDRVTTIGENAFHSCTALEKIIIPKSVTNIGLTAFIECDALTKVVMEGAAPPTINHSFSNALTVGGVTNYSTLPNLEDIIIPAGSLSSYSSYQVGDGWGAYTEFLSDPIFKTLESVSVDFYRGLITVNTQIGAIVRVFARFQMDGLFEIDGTEMGSDVFYDLLKSRHVHFLNGYIARQNENEEWETTQLLDVWVADEYWGEENYVYFGYAGVSSEGVYPPYESCHVADISVFVFQTSDHKNVNT